MGQEGEAMVQEILTILAYLVFSCTGAMLIGWVLYICIGKGYMGTLCTFHSIFLGKYKCSNKKNS